MSRSSYLDPQVAQQKRTVHLELVRRWLGGRVPRTVLKTDLYEEAFGSDHVLFDLAPGAKCVVGIDINYGTVAAARERCQSADFLFLSSDVRALGFETASFDLVFSNSTLDHFETQIELRASLKELARVVRPGGFVVITLDNPWNPLYPLLRWAMRLRCAPFTLGCTASRPQLRTWLSECGLEPLHHGWLIHNPRMLSTALFLALRKILGRSADAPIRLLLSLFAFLGRLPSRPLTACFVAVCARKPELPL